MEETHGSHRTNVVDTSLLVGQTGLPPLPNLPGVSTATADSPNLFSPEFSRRIPQHEILNLSISPISSSTHPGINRNLFLVSPTRRRGENVARFSGLGELGSPLAASTQLHQTRLYFPVAAPEFVLVEDQSSGSADVEIVESDDGRSTPDSDIEDVESGDDQAQSDNEDRPDTPQPEDGQDLRPGPPQTVGNPDERSGASQPGSRAHDTQFPRTALTTTSTSEPLPAQAVIPGLGGNSQPHGENATSGHIDVSQLSNVLEPQGLRVLTHQQESPADFRSPKRRRVISPAETGDRANQDDNEEEGECCSICFENWTNSGNHRLCSLKCGHLFGQSCIEKWLRGQGGKCPQCNAKAKRQDIRVIYAKSIKALDTAERDRALQELEKEKEQRRRVEMDLAQIRMQYQMEIEECNKLMGENDNLKQQLQKSRTTGGFSTSQSSPTKIYSQPLLIGQFTLDKTIKIWEGGNCRVMAYCQSLATLVVSQPSSSPLFPGFGVKKISTMDFKSNQYLMLHSKVIRDLAFHPVVDDGMLLSCGLDKKVKMTSIISNAVVQSFETPMPAWSCVWNVDDSNYFYTGLQNGIVLEFDVRNTETYVQELNKEGNKSPVAALQYLGQNNQALFSPGGLLVGQLDRVTFFEKKGNNERRPHILPLDGSLTSLCVEERTRHILASFRPTARHQTIRHQMCEMVCNNISNNPTVIDTVCSCNIIHTFHGSRTQTVLSKSIILSHPADQNRLMVCGADEPNQSVHVWDTGTGQMKQRLSAGGVVVDTCAININNQLYLAALTDKQLKIFKWS